MAFEEKRNDLADVKEGYRQGECTALAREEKEK